MKQIKHIGITGNIGSGKTTIAKYLEEKNFYVFEADEFVHQIYSSKKYKHIKEKIKTNFKECLKKSRLIKKCIKEIIFNDPQKKLILEEIIHPTVINQIINLKKKINQNKNYKKNLAFYIVPLIYEKKLEHLFDEIWVVFCPINLSIKRIIKRDKISHELAQKIIENQMNPLEKVKKADKVIINDKDIQSLYNQIDNLLKNTQ